MATPTPQNNATPQIGDSRTVNGQQQFYNPSMGGWFNAAGATNTKAPAPVTTNPATPTAPTTTATPPTPTGSGTPSGTPASSTPTQPTGSGTPPTPNPNQPTFPIGSIIDQGAGKRIVIGKNADGTPQVADPNTTYFYTTTQDANGNNVYHYYDGNGNALPTNPLGGDQYKNNPQGTPNSNGKLIALDSSQLATIEANSSGNANASTNGTITDANNGIVSSTNAYTKALNDLNNQADQAYNDYKTKLDQIENGTFPLTPSQQAILDATKAQFDTLRQQQIIANQTYTQGLSVYESRTGELTGGVETAMGNIKNSIDQGIAKLNALDSQAALTLANLQQGFQSDNLKMITDAYDAWTKYQSNKQNALKEIQDAQTSALKDLRDFTYKQTQDNINNTLKQASLALDQGKFDWQKTQDKIKNQIDQANLGINERKQALSEATFNLQKEMWGKIQNAPSVPMTSGAPDPVAQQNFLNQFPQQIQTLIKGIADYSILPSSIPIRLYGTQIGITQAQILAAVKQYDPSYDQLQVAARQKFLTNWTAGGQNSVIQAANTSIDHLARLYDQAKQLGNLPSGSLGPFTGTGNDMNAWLKAGSQDPNIYQFKQTAIALAGEIARIYKNGTGSSAAPTDDEIAQQLNIMSVGVSPDNAKGLIQNGINLMVDRLTSATENYQAVMGKTAPSILYDTALQQVQKLQDEGFNIDTSKVNPSQYSSTSNQDLINQLAGGSSASSTIDPTAFFNLFNSMSTSISQ